MLCSYLSWCFGEADHALQLIWVPKIVEMEGGYDRFTVDTVQVTGRDISLHGKSRQSVTQPQRKVNRE